MNTDIGSYDIVIIALCQGDQSVLILHVSERIVRTNGCYTRGVWSSAAKHMMPWTWDIHAMFWCFCHFQIIAPEQALSFKFHLFTGIIIVTFILGDWNNVVNYYLLTFGQIVCNQNKGLFLYVIQETEERRVYRNYIHIKAYSCLLLVGLLMLIVFKEG